MHTKIISWILQLIVVIILGQTLFFKFSDAPETVELFSQLGMGAFGYKLIGVLELFACIMLLIPASVASGALLSWGLMTGAILAHVTKLGFAADMAVLGGLAIVAWLLSLCIMYIHRAHLPVLSTVFKHRKNELNS